MRDLIDLFSDLANVTAWWRFFACLFMAVAICYYLQTRFGEAPWFWFAVVPIIIAGTWLGIRWESSSAD